MNNPQITRNYDRKHDFVWYEFTYNGCNLLSDNITHLVEQIRTVYGFDYRMYLLQFNLN